MGHIVSVPHIWSHELVMPGTDKINQLIHQQRRELLALRQRSLEMSARSPNEQTGMLMIPRF